MSTINKTEVDFSTFLAYAFMFVFGYFFVILFVGLVFGESISENGMDLPELDLIGLSAKIFLGIAFLLYGYRNMLRKGIIGFIFAFIGSIMSISTVIPMMSSLINSYNSSEFTLFTDNTFFLFFILIGILLLSYLIITLIIFSNLPFYTDNETIEELGVWSEVPKYKRVMFTTTFFFGAGMFLSLAMYQIHYFSNVMFFEVISSIFYGLSTMSYYLEKKFDSILLKITKFRSSDNSKESDTATPIINKSESEVNSVLKLNPIEQLFRKKLSILEQIVILIWLVIFSIIGVIFVSSIVNWFNNL